MAAHDVKSTELLTSNTTNLIDWKSADYKMSKIKTCKKNKKLADCNTN
jgi:hypothetical protein